MILKTDWCVGVGERQFGALVFGGDGGVEPCGAFCGGQVVQVLGERGRWVMWWVGGTVDLSRRRGGVSGTDWDGRSLFAGLLRLCE